MTSRILGGSGAIGCVGAGCDANLRKFAQAEVALEICSVLSALLSAHVMTPTSRSRVVPTLVQRSKWPLDSHAPPIFFKIFSKNIPPKKPEI